MQTLEVRNKEKQIIKVFLIAIVIAFALGTLFDKAISDRLVTETSIFSHLFEHYTVQGKNFVYFICFEMLTWITWRIVKERFVRVVLTGALLFVDLIQMLGVTYDYVYYTAAVMKNHMSGQSWSVSFNTAQLITPKLTMIYHIVSLILTIVCSVFFYRWIMKQSAEELDYSLKAALVGIFVIVAVSTSLDIMKQMWGRVRPRDLIDGQAHFTPWFKLNAGTEYRSFPSGHNVLSWFYLYLPFLVTRKNIKWQKILTYTGIIIGICSTYGRIRLGAHWLTDVTMATFMIVSAVYLGGHFLHAHFIENNEQN